MGRMFASVALAVALTGCADEPWQWTKPGATQAEFQTAAYECERDTRMAARSFGYGVVAQIEAEAFATRCMNARGFYKQSLRQDVAQQAAPTNAGPAHPSVNPAAWTTADLAEPGTRACVAVAQGVARQFGRGTRVVSALRVVEQHYGADPKAPRYRFLEFAPGAGNALAYVCGPDDSGVLAAMPMPTLADAASGQRRAVWEPYAAKMQTCQASGHRAAQLVTCAGPPPT